MDRARTRDANGKQKSEYYKAYYLENKERIAGQNKERYERMRATPELLQKHREKCTDASRRYRERHPVRVKQGAKITKQRRRIKVFEKLGGTVCCNCGCDEVVFLELNHKNGGGCQEFKKYGNHIYDMILNNELDINNYEVLCRVCNALDHLERKNPEASKHYQINWQNFTGQRAVKL